MFLQSDTGPQNPKKAKVSLDVPSISNELDDRQLGESKSITILSNDESSITVSVCNSSEASDDEKKKSESSSTSTHPVHPGKYHRVSSSSSTNTYNKKGVNYKGDHLQPQQIEDLG